jgi:hypothetical protein
MLNTQSEGTMQKKYTLGDFYDLEYYNKQRCADGDVVQYIAKRIATPTHFLITVKNDTVIKVQNY